MRMYQCDKCKEYTGQVHKIRIMNALSLWEQKELCPLCYKNFIEWINNVNTKTEKLIKTEFTTLPNNLNKTVKHKGMYENY